MDGFIDKYAQRKNAQEMIRANAMAEAEAREKMASKLSEYEAAIQEMRRCNLQTLENAEKVRELLAAGLSKIEEVQKKEEGPDQRSEELIRGMKDLSEELGRDMAELLRRQEEQAAKLSEGQKQQMADLRTEQDGRIEKMLEEQKSQVAGLLTIQSELLEKQNAQIQELMDAQKKMVEELVSSTEDFNHKEAVKVYRNVQAVIESALPKQTGEITDVVKKATEGKGISAGLKIMWALTLVAALANAAVEVVRFLGYM